MALSMDLREKVMKAIRGGMSRRQAAARFDIGPANAVRWAKRVEITGEAAPGKMGGDRRSQRIEAHADFILAQIKDRPDMTIMDLRDKIRERHGLAVGYGTVWRFLARHGITQEEDRPCRGAGPGGCRRGPRGMVRRRARSRPGKARFHRRDERLDEHGASPRARAERGARRASVPFGRWETTTLIAALRVDRIDAPRTIGGALDGRWFLAYVLSARERSS
jgi:transposase